MPFLVHPIEPDRQTRQRERGRAIAERLPETREETLFWRPALAPLGMFPVAAHAPLTRGPRPSFGHNVSIFFTTASSILMMGGHSPVNPSSLVLRVASMPSFPPNAG